MSYPFAFRWSMFRAVSYHLLIAMLCWQPLTCGAADRDSGEPLQPEIAEASGEPLESMAAIRLPEGWEVNVWAAEPDVANVVAFDIDHQGRIYVCETFRQNRGVTDNRGHDREWLLADLSAKTVQDRIDYHKRLLGDAAITYAQHDDRIRRLVDTDGDHQADQSVVVANGFNRLEEGTGAGILVRDDSVYYTCIPKLWKLVDQNDDGVADERIVLSDGYGVRVAFRGHDLHGLRRGYDGRLYFTIGDRGYHVRTAEGEVLADPASGAVFRCEMDGTGLEVFARGLRNPQEIDFNDRGDWFTVDNNSDSGDKARIVHLLQDGDTGWRMYYQYLGDRGPFNRERIWEPKNDAQPASIVPPVANFTDGPSGLAYYPGTGFGDRFHDTFLICDFRGGPSNSGIRSFRVEPKGASYELVADDQPVWTCLATDVAFGPDGALYVSDWVNGWDGLGKARMYRITDPSQIDSDVVREVERLLASDWTRMSAGTLTDGLSHVDRRVRLESQWELAKRMETESLLAVASDRQADATSRLHAIWGLGQITRALSRQALENTSSAAEIQQALVSILSGDDPVLLVAAAEIAGESGWSSAAKPLAELLKHESARVRYHAVDALGRLKQTAAFDAVVGLMTGADAEDPAMRHAVAMYLSRAAKAKRIAELTDHQSVPVRLAAVVALRRQKRGTVAEFLNDPDPKVVLEAARAIHDTPIEFSMGALAGLIQRPLPGDALARRVLNANFRMGTADAAAELARFATRAEADVAMRLEALEMLSDWSEPGPLDRVLGDYRPLESRDKSLAVEALSPQVDLLMAAPEKIRLKTIEVASKLGIKKIANALAKQVNESTRAGIARGEALLALARLAPPQAVELAKKLPAKTRGELGRAALTVLAAHDRDGSVERFVAAVGNSDLRIRQQAWDVLGELKTESASDAINAAVQRYLQGELDPKVQLNVLEAAQGRLGEDLQSRLSEYREQRLQSDPLGKWLDSLAGGDPEKGEQLFFTKTELSCVRCHKVGRNGGEVGPNLTTIGKDRDRRYLLESICLPDATVAKGFETAVIVDFDGKVYSGIVKTENDQAVELMLADGTQVKILQDDIELRRKGKSSMPADLIKHLNPRELRDLVAYLASLKVDPRSAGDVE
jgi:quinoprotein glucose dehydrogenase